MFQSISAFQNSLKIEYPSVIQSFSQFSPFKLPFVWGSYIPKPLLSYQVDCTSHEESHDYLQYIPLNHHCFWISRVYTRVFLTVSCPHRIPAAGKGHHWAPAWHCAVVSPRPVPSWRPREFPARWLLRVSGWLAAVWLADVCVCVCTYVGNCTYVMYPYIYMYIHIFLLYIYTSVSTWIDKLNRLDRLD